MTIKIGQVYKTAAGDVKVLSLEGTYANGALPVVIQRISDGQVMNLNKNGKILGSPTWDLKPNLATGFINVWPTEAEAQAHKKFAGQVTVPIQYEDDK